MILYASYALHTAEAFFWPVLDAGKLPFADGVFIGNELANNSFVVSCDLHERKTRSEEDRPWAIRGSESQQGVDIIFKHHSCFQASFVFSS